MVYLIEIVQRNRIVKVAKRTPNYDVALTVFQSAKATPVREVRFFKQDDKKGKILLKYVDKTATRTISRYA